MEESWVKTERERGFHLSQEVTLDYTANKSDESEDDGAMVFIKLDAVCNPIYVWHEVFCTISIGYKLVYIMIRT